jgi:octopine/nopaline transport system substrate-binding protein
MNLFKRKSLVAAVATALVFGASAAMLTAKAEAKEWKTVTIALEGAYEPWNFTNSDGSIGGFEPELAADVCARAKLDCKLIAQDWDGMITGLNAGKFDVIMDALSVTPERQQVIAFSIPYAATPASFAVLKSGPLANLAGTGTTITLGTDLAEQHKATEALREALKGKTIGLQTATVYAKFIYDNFSDVATIREYKTSAEHDLDLAAGRVDAVFNDSTYFTSVMSKPENADMAFGGPQIAGSVWGDGEALGLRKEDTDLKALLDPAIAAALADGTVKKLSEKYFKIDVSPK